jgi:cell division septation protein DedD
MEDDNLQKELFEFKTTKKAVRPGFGSLLQKTNFCLTLTGEKIVFLSIGIIMLMVIFFALGVEKGKSLAIKKDVQVTPIQVSANVAAQPILQNKAETVPTNITSKDKMAALPQELLAKDKPYMIVAAAFSRQESSSREVSLLKSSGLDAFVYKSEPYYLACVGSFASKGAALKLLGRVRQIHRDAYVRLK